MQQTSTATAERRAARRAAQGKTIYLTADRVLEIVRQHIQQENPNDAIEKARWSLDGVAVDCAT